MQAISGQSDAAETARAVVRIWREDGRVAFEVIDADPASIPQGVTGRLCEGPRIASVPSMARLLSRAAPEPRRPFEFDPARCTRCKCDGPQSLHGARPSSLTRRHCRPALRSRSTIGVAAR